jgi:(E)-4-hydroxy-3-methylbut-2-enyl-diphosphate synthase
MSGKVMIPRRVTRQVNVGGVKIGGGAPISVQSMTKTDTRDAAATLAQIRRLGEAGCEIIRCAVPDEDAALALHVIVRESPIPVVADIHFSPKLAMMALEAGVHKLRLNPGNIRNKDKTREIVRIAKDRGVPIRIGINAGSLDKSFLERDGWPSPQGMVDSALGHIELLEELDFRDIVVSLKATDTPRTFAAYSLLAQKCDYPFHLGITESGAGEDGMIKSSVGLGAILMAGIGDTIRVSLSEDSEKEIEVGFRILQSVGARFTGPEFISCPSCGRVEIDLHGVAKEVKDRLRTLKTPITIAVMGCAVNGPGESREADLGFSGGKGQGAIFRKGQLIRTVSEEEAVDAIVEEAWKLAAEKEAAGL